MKTIINDDFLLKNKTSKVLYHQYAKEMPIIDYHSHLSAKEIYEDRQFETISDIWLEGDHYKWRLMRANGIDENLITGQDMKREKFSAFLRTIPKALGNPVYHWSHLELKRYFGLDVMLHPKNEELIWNKTSERLQEGLSVRKFIKNSNVVCICTTDDPTDDLKYHIELQKTEYKILPTFRPDKGMVFNENFIPWLKKLEALMKTEIKDFSSYLELLNKRVEAFSEIGCKMADHSLENFKYVPSTLDECLIIFEQVLKGEIINDIDSMKLKSQILVSLGATYKSFGWAMQLHIGALRNNNSRMFDKLGVDVGFDSMDDGDISSTVGQLMNAMDKDNQLPKTILYNLNPKDNVTLATMAANFQSSEAIGKIQFGPAWWFNDNKKGMENQLIDLSSHGLLGNFIGMLTDSRSFMSFTRHEYFRRILCNLIGQWAEDGEVINDTEVLGMVVQDICFNNIKNYLELEV